jgi:transcriptional regulator with XRE-family HTH domain
MKYPIIAHNFKLFRSFSKLTAQGIADALGASRGAIESYLGGKSQPGAKLVQKAANYFNLSADQIMSQKLTEQDLQVTGRTKTLPEVELEAAKREIALQANTIEDLRKIITLLERK